MGLKGALLILLEAIKIKVKSLPPSAFGTFPHFAGEGKAIGGSLELVLSLPLRSGGSCPEWG